MENTSDSRTARRGGVRELLRVAGPLAFAQMAGAVNHVCDRYFLAQSGDSALEASLPALMVSAMVTTIFTATVSYSATFVAQAHGGGRAREAVKAFGQGLWLAALALPLFALLVPVSFGIVNLAGHAPDVAAAEKSFIAIYTPSLAVTMLNAVLGGLITGQGRTRFVSFASIIGCLSNLALNPVLIFGWGPIPAMGITGAAIASAAAPVVTAVMLAFAAFRDPLLRAHRDALRPDAKVIMRILRFGLPFGVASFTACVAFTMFTLAIGRLSGEASAASNTIFAVNNILYLILLATGDGVCILTGRHHGAGDDEAARRTFRSGLAIVATAFVVYFAVLLPGSGSVMDLFRGAESSFDAASYREIGRNLIFILFFREIAEATLYVVYGALRGVGDTRYAMFAQLVCSLLWLPTIFVVYRLTGSVYALWATTPVYVGLTVTMLVLRWRSGKWRPIRL